MRPSDTACERAGCKARFTQREPMLGKEDAHDVRWVNERLAIPGPTICSSLQKSQTTHAADAIWVHEGLHNPAQTMGKKSDNPCSCLSLSEHTLANQKKLFQSCLNGDVGPKTCSSRTCCLRVLPNPNTTVHIMLLAWEFSLGECMLAERSKNKAGLAHDAVCAGKTQTELCTACLLSGRY